MLQIIALIGIINYIILKYTEISDGVKAYVMIMTTLLMLWIFTSKETMEGLDATVQNSSYEAIQNIASMYNNGSLKVTNLEVTGDAKINGNMMIGGNSTVTGNLKSNDARIGQWNIRSNRIGIPGRADILNGNVSIGIYDYDTQNYRAKGIAARSFLENDGSINDVALSDKYIRKNTPIQLTNSYGNLTCCTQTVCNGVLAMAGGQNNTDPASYKWTINSL